MTVPINMIHHYQIWQKGIGTLPPNEPEQQHIGYKVEDCVWVKTLNEQYMSLYARRQITGVINHVRNLHPIIGSSALESRIDSESFIQSAKMITISDACGDPPEASSPKPNADASDDTSINKSSSCIIPQRSMRQKRQAPGCHIGKCSRSER